MRSASRRLQKFRPRLEPLEGRVAPSGSDWVPVNSGTVNRLNDVNGFFDGPDVLAVGDAGTILVSRDNGATWQHSASGTTQPLFGIGGPILSYVVGANGTILHSPDNGNTWLPQVSGTGAWLHAVASDSSGNDLFAVGDFRTILHSNNGGATWVPQNSAASGTLNSVLVEGGFNVVLAVGTGGTILRSTNDGQTWAPVNSGTTNTLHHLVDDGIFGVFAVGEGGVVLRSFDVGMTWAPVPSGTVNALLGITKDGLAQLFAVGSIGTIIHSSNQGASFASVEAGTLTTLNAVWAEGSSPDVFAVGNGGTILHFSGVKLTATGADAGGAPEVRVFDSQTGVLVRDFLAYDPGFRGGVRVAVGNVDPHGSVDIITAPGPGGGPDVRVFDGQTGQLIREFLAYDAAFRGGVFVAYGQQSSTHGLMGFFRSEIITGAGPGGGPHVKVFNGSDGSLISSFFAYDAGFRGGVRVATWLSGGGSAPDIITGAGPGGGPHVKVFSGTDGSVLQSFFAYDARFRGGVYVSALGTDIVTGAGAGGGPDVRVFSGTNSSLLREFFAYDAGFRGGVRVGVVDDLNGNGGLDIVTTPGPGGGPDVRFFDGQTLALLDEFSAFDPAFLGGVFVVGFS